MPERDPVDALREHVDAAHAAADRLVREAQQRAEEADREHRERLGAEPPPRGWDVGPEHQPSGKSTALPDLQAIVALLDQLRGSIPPEISAQLAEALRELLLAVRALLDWYIERLEGVPRPGGGAGASRGGVEDIPIS